MVVFLMYMGHDDLSSAVSPHLPPTWFYRLRNVRLQFFKQKNKYRCIPVIINA